MTFGLLSPSTLVFRLKRNSPTRSADNEPACFPSRDFAEVGQTELSPKYVYARRAFCERRLNIQKLFIVVYLLFEPIIPVMGFISVVVLLIMIIDWNGENALRLVP